MVDAGVGCGVRHGLKWRAGTAGVRGSCHLPAEVDGGLVDARVLAALLCDGVLGVVGVTRGHADQGVARRRGLLAALFGHLLHIVVV